VVVALVNSRPTGNTFDFRSLAISLPSQVSRDEALKRRQSPHGDLFRGFASRMSPPHTNLIKLSTQGDFGVAVEILLAEDCGRQVKLFLSQALR